MYKYRNCREIEVMNDDVAENESEMMLAHFTCWRGLGSPATLDIDQTLWDSLAIVFGSSTKSSKLQRRSPNALTRQDISRKAIGHGI